MFEVYLMEILHFLMIYWIYWIVDVGFYTIIVFQNYSILSFALHFHKAYLDLVVRCVWIMFRAFHPGW